MKYAALVALVGVVAVTTGGCASMAKGNSATRSAGLADSKLVGHHPPNANTLYGMARLLRSQNKNDQAEFVLLSVLRDHPAFSPTYNDLAEIRMSQNRFDEAVEYLDKGIAVAPNDAVLLNNAGVCALLKRDYAAALVYFQRASMIAPYEGRYKANVALAMGLNGEHKGSRVMYGQIISADDADFNANLIRNLAKPAAVKAVAYQAPVETPYQDAELDMTQTTSAFQAERMEALSADALATPVAVDETKSVEAAQPEESVPSLEAAAVGPVAPAELVETSSAEAVQAMVSFTNPEVETLNADTITVGLTSEAAGPEESVGPKADAIAFAVEAVEAEPAHIEQAVEASDAGESSAGPAFETQAAQIEPGPQAIEPGADHVAFGIEEGEPAMGDDLAFVLEGVEPEKTPLAPERTVQEREWVDGEFLLAETAPEDHVVPNPVVDAAAGDAQPIELAQTDVFEQLGEEPADYIIETKRLDESTD